MSLLRSLNAGGLEKETQEKNPLLMKKNNLKKEMKYGDPYKICQNCNGNGYVRIIPYSETQTCKECMGAGHFEQDKTSTKHEPDTKISTGYVLKLIKILEEFIRGKKRTIH